MFRIANDPGLGIDFSRNHDERLFDIAFAYEPNVYLYRRVACGEEYVRLGYAEKTKAIKASPKTKGSSA